MTDSAWPPENTEPTEDMPFYCSGEYSADPLNVSPEGNVYGQERCVVMDPRPWWWTGEAWVEIPTDKATIVAKGQVNSVSELPPQPETIDDIWQVRYYNAEKNEYYWVEYYWDPEHSQWKYLTWLSHVNKASDLPRPGHFIGEAHWVMNWHQKYRWVGTHWQKPKHSELYDDEPEKHATAGLLQGIETLLTDLQGDLLDLTEDVEDRYGQMSRFYSPDARLVFLSPTEIGIQRVIGGAGVVCVAGEWILADPSRSVTNTMKALGWNSDTHSLYQVPVQADTHYWIYLANTKSQEFNFPDHDYRGKLFLSPTQDTDDYLSDSGAGANARLVGQVTTDHSAPPQFHRDLNLSLINRLTNFAETFREFSDYQLVFVDQDHLQMSRGYGLYGQIDIAGYLYYLGASTPVLNRAGNDSNRVEWDDEAEEKVILDSSPILASQLYYAYISADVDAFNFNAINPATSRPWQLTDAGSEGHYFPDLDLRLKPFLSKKAPEAGVMSAQWPGYTVRYIGQIRTDNNGHFIYSSDISAIRQMTLNPAHLDGLAECSLVPMDEVEFRLCRKGGTSGVVMVGGLAVQTFEKFDADVHRVTNSDLAQAYTESAVTSPLTNQNPVSTYNQDLYVYLANYRSLWGSHAGKLFVSTTAATQGYLSRNWPGNQARWIATIRTDANGKFTGSYVIEALTGSSVRINDAAVTLNDTWSSAKIQAELNKLWASFEASATYAAQKVSGCPIRLAYRDATHLAIIPTTEAAIVVFPDMTTRTFEDEVLITPTGSPGTTYYVWLKQASIEINTTTPTETFAKMAIHGTDAILLGYFCVTSTDTMSGVQNVYSYVHEPERQWSATINVGTPFSIGPSPGDGINQEITRQTPITLAGLLIPPGVTGAAVRPDGYTRWKGKFGANTFHTLDLTGVDDDALTYTVSGHSCNGSLTLSMSPGDGILSGIYNQISLDIRLRVEWHAAPGWLVYWTVEFHTGTLVVTRPGS